MIEFVDIEGVMFILNSMFLKFVEGENLMVIGLVKFSCNIEIVRDLEEEIDDDLNDGRSFSRLVVKRKINWINGNEDDMDIDFVDKVLNDVGIIDIDGIMYILLEFMEKFIKSELVDEYEDIN